MTLRVHETAGGWPGRLRPAWASGMAEHGRPVRPQGLLQTLTEIEGGGEEGGREGGREGEPERERESERERERERESST